jgi:ABA sandwich protein
MTVEIKDELRIQDVQVAQKIFNQSYPFVGEPWNDYVQRETVIAGKVCPHYSKDIAAADLIIERLNPELPFKMQWYFWEGLWHAWFGENEGTGLTRPSAICRAALSIRGESKECEK